MAVIPTTFPKEQPQAVASFNFTDIVNGLGFSTFQGFQTINDTTFSYGAGPNVIFSSGSSTLSSQNADTSFAKWLDLDFDTSTFNLARDVKGIAYMNISFGARSNDAGDCETYCLVKLFHVAADTTETQLGSTQMTKTLQEPRTGDDRSVTDALQFDISQTRFKRGDLLRINVEGWGKVTANTGQVRIYHDPADRTPVEDTDAGVELADTTKLELHVPFKIDL